MPEADPDALRAEVRRLRDENAATRQRAKRADSLAARLVTAHAAATGRLADPDDLPYDPALLDEDGLPDPERVTAAVDEALRAIAVEGQSSTLPTPGFTFLETLLLNRWRRRSA